MKKTILCLVASLGLSTIGSAQNLKVGLQFTPSVSKLSFNNLPSLLEGPYRDGISPALTYSLGAFGEYGITDQIGVRVGLNYMTTGENSSISEILTVEETRTRTRLHYLEIPILGTYSLSNGVFFNAGLSPAFYLNTSYNTKTTYTNGDTDKSKSTEKGDDMNSMNLFLKLGVGYRHELQDNISLELQPNFSYGLMSLSSDEDWNRKSINYGLTMAVTYGL